jgi:hypothetical protein
MNYSSEQNRQIAELANALRRIADSQPRPLKNGSYPAHEVEALQRIASVVLKKVNL